MASTYPDCVSFSVRRNDGSTMGLLFQFSSKTPNPALVQQTYDVLPAEEGSGLTAVIADNYGAEIARKDISRRAFEQIFHIMLDDLVDQAEQFNKGCDAYSGALTP